MCNSEFNPRLAPLTKEVMKFLIKAFPEQASFIQDIYGALTANLAPQANLLVLFALLRHQHMNKALGILSTYGLQYVPLSIVAKTNDHEWTRFRPRAVKELHTSFLSFMMAETNRIAVNEVCHTYGLTFGQGHCCGVLFGKPEDLRTYQCSELYKDRNLLRSSIESMAMDVIETPFENIPENTIDLGAAEREFFDMYESCCLQLPLTNCREDIPENFIKKIDTAWERVIIKTPYYSACA